MKKFNVITIVLFMTGMLYLSVVEASDDNTTDLQKNYAHVLQEIKQIQTELSNRINKSLLLGSEQSEIEISNYALGQASTSLESLKKYELIRQNKQINLEWKTASSPTKFDKNETANYLNANVENSGVPVYICRAEFLGANYGTKGVYPGSLSESGCKISYAGYAFYAPRYQILVNNNKNLVWMPAAKIKAFFHIGPPTSMNAQNQPNKINYRSDINYDKPEYAAFESLFHINPLKQPLLIAGGYEGERPVYMCRAKYNNTMYPGKFVIYQGENFTPGSACDIPVNDKEITIKNDYDLLAIMPDTIDAAK